MTVGIAHFAGKTILITGASTGIGKASARFFFNRGWNVIATMRNPAAETELSQGVYKQSNRLKCIQLDVCDLNSIQTAFNEAITYFGKIDVVVNNAGYGLTGVFEGMTRAQIERQFQTNVFGLMDVSRMALQHFREFESADNLARDCVLINIASVAGRTAVPLYSIYHATKWAVEGFTESLQFECAKMENPAAGHPAPNVRVKLIEPGVVLTDFYIRSADRAEPEKTPGVYSEYERRVRSLMDRRSNRGSKPEDVAAAIYRAATDESKRLRYPVGWDAVFLLFIRPYLPDGVYRAMVNWVMEHG